VRSLTDTVAPRGAFARHGRRRQVSKGCRPRRRRNEVEEKEEEGGEEKEEEDESDEHKTDDKDQAAEVPLV